MTEEINFCPRILFQILFQVLISDFIGTVVTRLKCCLVITLLMTQHWYCESNFQSENDRILGKLTSC